MIFDIGLTATLATVLGVIASISFLLQTLKIERLHESRDVSLPMYILLFVNAIVWVAYGVQINNTPLMISNSIGAISTATVILVYLRYERKPKK